VSEDHYFTADPAVPFTRAPVHAAVWSSSGTLRFTAEGAHAGMPDRLSQLAPLKFVTSPGLWIGLAFTAACLAAAVRLRRNREPI